MLFASSFSDLVDGLYGPSINFSIYKKEQKDFLTYELLVPGYKSSDLKMTYNSHLLLISGSRMKNEAKFSFEKVLAVNDKYDCELTEALVEDGILYLKITLKSKKTLELKEIKINVKI